MGFNYYITSERYLDENISKYPEFIHGGNELQVYADLEAVRISHGQPSGLPVLLREAWEKYRLPIAITEVQLNCGREDQKRWLKEVWDNCLQLCSDGINIKAITAWSLFGAFGWDKLLTSKKMNYEPGAFDIRSGVPRATALTTVIKSLATSQNYSHPLLVLKGWWHRDSRFVHDKEMEEKDFNLEPGLSQPILIFGKNGTLGKAFGKICGLRGIYYKLLSRQETDITSEEQIEEAINKYKPWAIINTAGYVRVDDAERDFEKCFAENNQAACLLAIACKNQGIQFITFSSDLVFDGNRQTPYVESDSVNPLNVYGTSKAQAEAGVLKANPDALVIRTSAFFGPWDNYNFVSDVINTVSENRPFVAADDVFISPTYVPDLVNTSLDLLIDNEKGIWHITNKGEITWVEFAKKVCKKLNLNTDIIEGRPMHTFNLPAPRPGYSVLKSEKGIMLPSLNNALARYFHERNTVAAEINKVNK